MPCFLFLFLSECFFVEAKNTQDVERTAADSYTTNKIPYTSLKGRNGIMPHYRERIKKNKPIYAAYTKETI